MVSNNRHWKNQHRKREGGENPPTSSPLSIQAHSIIDMAFRRGISHRRPSVCTVLKLMCLIFVTTCHHRCRCLAFSSNTSIRPLNGDRKILVNSLLRPLQNKHVNTIERQLVLSGHVTDEVEIRSRPNIFVIKTHEDYVKFLEEDDRLCVISKSPLVVTVQY